METKFLYNYAADNNLYFFLATKIMDIQDMTMAYTTSEILAYKKK